VTADDHEVTADATKLTTTVKWNASFAPGLTITTT
jgi:hypothetical protein